ncbi:MAG: class I tRNA ligase family protein, partial [Nanoarchaeota archaeon]
MSSKFSVDAARVTILSGGEGLDDPNWDSTFATAFKQKLQTYGESCTTLYNTGRENHELIDAWMDSRLHEIIRDATAAMEETQFRTASQLIFFELQGALKWYLKRCHNHPQKTLMNHIIEAQLIMLSPFTPHICEEIWETLGKKGFICEAQWPVVNKQKIQGDLEIQEEIIKTVLGDVTNVLKLIKKQPQKITLFVSVPWKYQLYRLVHMCMETTKNPKVIIQQVMEDKDMKKHGNDIMKFLPKIISSGKIIESLKNDDAEVSTLHHAKTFLEREFGCLVEIMKAGNSGHPKASQASPGKPAILVE